MLRHPHPRLAICRGIGCSKSESPPAGVPIGDSAPALGSQESQFKINRCQNHPSSIIQLRRFVAPSQQLKSARRYKLSEVIYTQDNTLKLGVTTCTRLSELYSGSLPSPSIIDFDGKSRGPLSCISSAPRHPPRIDFAHISGGDQVESVVRCRRLFRSCES